MAQLLSLYTFDLFPIGMSLIIGFALQRYTTFHPKQLEANYYSRNTLALVITLAFAIFTLAVYFVHRGHAIITDAQSQIAQAYLILNGKFRLFLSPQLLDAAALPNFARTSPTFAQYPPGHILLLLPFLALNLSPNFLNVLCGAACVYYTYKLCFQIAGKSAATAACLLLICSPLFIIMQSSAMNHGSTALTLLIAGLGFL